MKKLVLSLVIMAFCVSGMTQNQAYYQKMGETLGMFGKAKSLDDFKNVANQFKIISKVANEEWLPLYYHAHIHILLSFMDNSSAEKKDEYLAIADESIQKMLEINDKEVEIMALQAFYFTGKLVVDPMTRGAEYGMLFGQTIGKAMAIDAKNPRVRFLKLSNEVNSASFFGKDPKQYKNAVELLFNEWDDYELKSPLHPRWGKRQVEGLIKQTSE